MRRLNRTAATSLVLALALAFAAMPAAGGWLGLGKKTQARQLDRPRRFETAANVRYQAGTLGRSHNGGWALGEVELILTEHTSIWRLDDPETPADLTDGAEVYVMGNASLSGLTCREILVVPYASPTPSGQNPESIIWSTADPTVGAGTGPN